MAAGAWLVDCLREQGTRVRIEVAGHFGEWMQGRLGRAGPVALITLPCPAICLCGYHLAGGPGLRLAGAGLHVSQVRRFLRGLGLGLGGRVRLRASVAPGLGTGMSTAQLVALARLAGWDGPPERLAQACLRMEGASDPLMFGAPERLLWASRAGVALDLMPRLPRYEMIGGFWGGPQRTEARDDRFPDISDLCAAWPRARTLAEVAALASESARRTLALRGPADDPVAGLSRDLGALGMVMAHTGAARGLIFAPGTVPREAAQMLRQAGLRHVLRFTGGGA